MGLGDFDVFGMMQETWVFSRENTLSTHLFANSVWWNLGGLICEHFSQYLKSPLWKGTYNSSSTYKTKSNQQTENIGVYIILSFKII